MERAIKVPQKLQALFMAAAGFTVLAMMTVLSVAAAPYANAAEVINNVWVPVGTRLTPMYQDGVDSQPIGYILTDDAGSTVCKFDAETETYTCFHVATKGK